MLLLRIVYLYQQLYDAMFDHEQYSRKVPRSSMSPVRYSRWALLAAQFYMMAWSNSVQLLSDKATTHTTGASTCGDWVPLGLTGRIHRSSELLWRALLDCFTLCDVEGYVSNNYIQILSNYSVSPLGYNTTSPASEHIKSRSPGGIIKLVSGRNGTRPKQVKGR